MITDHVPKQKALQWTVVEIKGGYAVFEGGEEIYRQFGHKMGLQRLVDRHNLSLMGETEAERFARRLDNEP